MIANPQGCERVIGVCSFRAAATQLLERDLADPANTGDQCGGALQRVRAGGIAPQPGAVPRPCLSILPMQFFVEGLDWGTNISLARRR